MFFKIALLILGLLVIYGYAGIDVCNNKYTIHDAVQQCYDDEFLDVIVPIEINLNTSFTQSIQNNPIGIYPFCNETDAYTRAQLCADSISRKCTNDSEINPIRTELAKALPFICSHQHDLDQQCLQKHYRAIADCAKSETDKAMNSTDSTDDIVEIVCMIHSISSHCADVHLFPCGARTRLLYKKFTKFFLPKGCYFSTPIVG